jgi:quinol monooxygenase YgiN
LRFNHQGVPMSINQLLVLGASALAAFTAGPAVADDMQRQYVQVAEIEIDPAQLENYKAAVTEQIETAISVEQGVLVLYAVSEKDNPTRVRVFEIYRDAEAYRSHLETAHFKKYKATTEKMVRSLKLVQTIPIALGTKAR